MLNEVNLCIAQKKRGNWQEHVYVFMDQQPYRQGLIQAPHLAASSWMFRVKYNLLHQTNLTVQITVHKMTVYTTLKISVQSSSVNGTKPTNGMPQILEEENSTEWGIDNKDRQDDRYAECSP